MEITFEPDLSHCIETVAKRQYERVLSVLLKTNDENQPLEDELELLRLFLVSADFGALRSQCDDLLLAGKRVKVRLRSTEGLPEYEFEAEGQILIKIAGRQDIVAGRDIIWFDAVEPPAIPLKEITLRCNIIEPAFSHPYRLMLCFRWYRLNVPDGLLNLVDKGLVSKYDLIRRRPLK